MRNKGLAAGFHLLPLHVSGAWSYGAYSHYPHGPYPTRHNSRCSVGEGVSQIHSKSPCTAQMCSKLFRCSCFPMDSGLAPQSVAQPVLAAAGLRPRQPRLSTAGDCGARLGDFKNLANMAPPLSVPKYGGSQRHVSTFPQNHKAQRRAIHEYT